MRLAESPYRPRRIAGDPEGWNLLLGFARQPLPLADPSAELSFDLSEAPPETAVAIAFRGARGPRLLAVFEQVPFGALLDAQLDMEDLATLPPQLRDALLRGVLALVWDALPENRLGLCAVESVGALRDIGVDGAADWFAFEIYGLADEPIAGRLGCAQGALGPSLLSGAVAPARIDRALRERLEIDVFLSLGRLRLRIAQTRGLKCGDVVMLGEEATRRFIVRAARANWEAHPAGDGLTVVAVTWSGAQDQEERDIVDAPEADEGLDVSKLTIDIDLDIGRVSKPLAEVESWRAGALIEIEPPALADGLEVTLRVNGAPVGVGDLVTIDDRIAVRISRWTL